MSSTGIEIIDLTCQSDEEERDVVTEESFSRKWQNNLSSHGVGREKGCDPYVLYGINTVVDQKECHLKRTEMGMVLDEYSFDERRHAKPRYMNGEVFDRVRMTLGLTMNERAVQRINTEAMIPREVKLILGFGPKFCIPIPFNKSSAQLLLCGIQRLNEYHLAVYEQRTISAMAKRQMEHIFDNRTKYTTDMQRFVIHCYNCTIRFFAENTELVIALADKGNVSIIMPKHDYIQKVEEHLADRNTYTPIVTSCKAGYERKNEFFLRKLVELDLVKRNEMAIVMQSETKIPNLYGLIKLHKEAKPIRPVVNTRSGPGYRLAKVLANLLAQAQETHKYNVRNSMDVAERLSLVVPDADEVFATFDIISMFTNINVELAVASVTKRYRLGRFKTTIPLKLFVDILRFVIGHSTELEFNDKLYKQVRGLKMGSSLSPILADFVVEDILDGVFEHIQRPKIFTKYVDDCLALARLTHIRAIERALNAKVEGIQFLCELEDEQGFIVYLDMRIHNTGAFKMVTKWFQKPMASGRILNFYSTHQESTIYNTAKCFVYNMFNLSDGAFATEMHGKARHILKLNNFPEAIVERIIDEAVRKWKLEGNCQEMYNGTLFANDIDAYELLEPRHGTQRPTRRYAALPYYPEITPLLQQEIKKFNKSLSTTGRPMSAMKRRLYDRHKRLHNVFEDGRGPQYVRVPVQKGGRRRNKGQKGTENRRRGLDTGMK